jgi:hypothetical protein
MFFGRKEYVCCVDMDEWMFIGSWGGGGKFCNSVKGFVSKNLFSGEDFILRGFPYVKRF